MSSRQILRRVGAGAILVAQLALVVRAYDADHAFFGFQMFPESSEWQATIKRELADGTVVDIREPWPGGYRWVEMVPDRGLSQPWVRHHADAGIRSTLHFLAASLGWVLDNIPADPETVGLRATVTVWRNGDPPEPVLLEVQR